MRCATVGVAAQIVFMLLWLLLHDCAHVAHVSPCDLRAGVFDLSSLHKLLSAQPRLRSLDTECSVEFLAYPWKS